MGKFSEIAAEIDEVLGKGELHVLVREFGWVGVEYADGSLVGFNAGDPQPRACEVSPEAVAAAGLPELEVRKYVASKASQWYASQLEDIEKAKVYG